jgi:O-6-methylguanine DNA methyltransferase
MNAETVFSKVSCIPKGNVSTYKAIATACGYPNNSRQVGRILQTNPTPLIIPCHRVIFSNGKIGGYFGHKESEDKIKLLQSEGIEIIGGKIQKNKLKEYLISL